MTRCARNMTVERERELERLPARNRFHRERG
jgi:hypothetical protein